MPVKYIKKQIKNSIRAAAPRLFSERVLPRQTVKMYNQRLEFIGNLINVKLVGLNDNSMATDTGMEVFKVRGSWITIIRK